MRRVRKGRIIVSEIYPFITATNFGKNTGWAIQLAADPRLITPRATSLNSSPASFCRLPKKAKRSISRMIVFARWLGRGLGRLGKQSAVLSW
jgi:hypothetical protein